MIKCPFNCSNQTNDGYCKTTECINQAFKGFFEPDVFIPPACKHCLNHPSNGGSGICNCILGLQTIMC